MSRKTYFRMPSFDYPPNGRIQLGQIITSPMDPYERLADPLPIEDQAIVRNTKTDYHEVIEKARKGNVGLWVQFLASFFGIGGDVSAKWVTEHSQIFQFRELEANCFEPEDKYLIDSIASSEKVRDHIQKSPGKSLYMVTGLKIAHGAKIVLQEKQGHGLNAKLGVDATVLTGGPVKGGPAFMINNSQHTKMEIGGSKDFVFAYRLVRIIPKPRGVVKKKRHEAGATTYGNDEEYVKDFVQEEEAEYEPGVENIEIAAVGLDRLDYGAMPATLPFKVDTRKVREDEVDDRDCSFIIPQREDD
ncbi:hypothetical protein L207DRAFT_579707 [Hyaloscypha variabilis F]|uniref:Uncharacterized protein n=1 Tax=Hyaloscypha variabilis (strain UAMH 11265 / GT02V1 / F) TaxID=1149755 RepID=A0A2J6S1Y2_HYAVF|nr:hypothetical protein L207DRAFT_579707 [Hyaloscypha variabilis F]